MDPVLPAWKTSGSTRCFGVRLRERLRGREGEEREPRRCRRGGRDRALAFARRSAAPSRFSSAPRRSCSRARLGARRRARRSLVALARRGRHCSRRSPAGALAPPHRSLLPLAPAPEAHTLLSHTNRSTCSLLGTQARPQSSPARPEQLDSPVRALSSFYRSRQCPLSLCYLLGRTEHGGGANRTASLQCNGRTALSRSSSSSSSSSARRAARLKAARAFCDERLQQPLLGVCIPSTRGRRSRCGRADGLSGCRASSRSRSSRQHRRSPARCARCDARSAARDARTRAEALSALVLSGRTRTKRGRRHYRTALDS